MPNEGWAALTHCFYWLWTSMVLTIRSTLIMRTMCTMCTQDLPLSPIESKDLKSNQKAQPFQKHFQQEQTVLMELKEAEWPFKQLWGKRRVCWVTSNKGQDEDSAGLSLRSLAKVIPLFSGEKLNVKYKKYKYKKTHFDHTCLNCHQASIVFSFEIQSFKKN